MPPLFWSTRISAHVLTTRRRLEPSTWRRTGLPSTRTRMAGVVLTMTRGGSFLTGLGAAAVTWASVIASAAWIRSSEIRATSRGRRRSSTFCVLGRPAGLRGERELVDPEVGERDEPVDLVHLGARREPHDPEVLERRRGALDREGRARVEARAVPLLDLRLVDGDRSGRPPWTLGARGRSSLLVGCRPAAVGRAAEPAARGRPARLAARRPSTPARRMPAWTGPAPTPRGATADPRGRGGSRPPSTASSA